MLVAYKLFTDTTSVFRVQSPPEYGDDLSSFRHKVVESNKRQTLVTGLEDGVSCTGFRYVVPLSYNNESTKRFKI